MPSASFSSSRSYVRRSRRKGGHRIPLPSRTQSSEPCESVPCPNNVTGSAMAATACAGPSGSGGGGSPPVPAAAAATTAGHHSPYDLRRKSPPAYHEPGPSGSCSLPARKRPRTSLSQGVDVCNVSQYLQYELPDEVLLCILSHLTERDLCRVAQVCKRFNTIANDTELWKSLYQSVFEYDTPLMHPAPCQFEFVAADECEADNPWKESFRQLYYGIHVRPNFRPKKDSRIKYFNTIRAALEYVEERGGSTSTSSGSSSACACTCSCGAAACSCRRAPAPAPAPASAPASAAPSEDLPELLYDVRGNFSLHCQLPNDNSLAYVWKKNETAIEQVWELKERYQLERGGAEFRVARAYEDDFGNYSCALAGAAREQRWAVRGRPHLKLPANTNVVEGQKLKLVCKVVGKPYARVTWGYTNASEPDANYTDAAEVLGSRASLADSEQGVPDGVLLLDEAQRSDAGRYRCGAPGALAPAVTTLRVKDMYAALWPFLGICAEVFVLCAIILVYEKRRTKPELDDSDTDNHDQKKS